MKRILLLVAVSLLTNALLQAQTYTDIEAVEYDYTQNRYFVSNNTSIIARSSNGTLSFFGSAQAAYGMEVGDGHLFAIKGSAVRAYDLNTAALVMTATVPGAGFLNGMAIDTARNHVYVTDFSTKKIIKIDYSNFAAPVITTFVANTVQTPNGITYDELNDRLVYVTWGSSAKVKGVNITTAAQTDLYTTTLSNIDGIDNDGQGNFTASKGADLMLHEALNKEMIAALGKKLGERGQAKNSQIMTDIQNYHASPEDAARSASEAGVQALVLYHMVPAPPVRLIEPLFVGQAPKLFKGTLKLADDGMIISLPAGGKDVKFSSAW